jgi:hypothetical protein
VFDDIYLQTNSLGESKTYQAGLNVLLEAGKSLLSRCLDVRDSSVKPSRTSESTWSLSGIFDPVAKSRNTFSELGDSETSQCGFIGKTVTNIKIYVVSFRYFRSGREISKHF